MCIAILNTKGTTLKRQLLSNCWENNGDGAGILYIDDDGKLQTFKTLDSFEEFYANYVEIKQTYGKKRNMLIHFRISTHGIIDETNCHPFITDENVGFIHNGMISNVPDSVQYSDTYMLNKTCLQNMKVGFEQNDDALEFLGEFIGLGNKLVFLNAKDEWAIVNETAGHWKYNCWFSNDSYEQVNIWYDFGGVKKQKGSRVGFTPSYNYNDYYLGGWDDDKDDKGSFGTCDKCSDCGMNLYGMNELNRGNCDYCERGNKDLEMLEKEAEKARIETCDCCSWHDGEYVDKWKAHVCEECLEALDGPTVKELGA